MYEEMIEYVRKYFEMHDPSATGLSVKFPFRNRFEHIMRVYHWAMRLCEVIECDREVVAVSAIFHDIGKAVGGDRPHAEVSAEMCDEYLESTGYSPDRRGVVFETIRLHSSKLIESDLLTIEQRVLIDADLLDEVGALAVIWDTMAVALDREPGYYKVYIKQCDIYEKLKKQKIFLKTEYGKQLYEGRLKVLSGFISELELELGLK